jgi:hypothetical protein
MSTMAPAKQEGGYFPHWKEKTGGVILPEERLPADPDDGVERRAQLVAHVGEELRLVLAPSISLTFSAQRFLHTTWHRIRLQFPRF